MKKRLYSLLLASVLMAASLPASQAASSPVANASKSVAVEGKPKSVSAVRVNLADPDIRIISVTAGNVGDVAELTDIIAKIDPSAYELLAAVNGAFFRSYDAGAQPIVGTIILTANPASEAPETASGPAQRSFAGLSADAKTLVFGTVGSCSFTDLQQVAKAYNLHDAMNLDGGASSALWLGGKVVTKPGRKLSNIIAVVRVKDWSKFDQSHAQKQSAPNIEKAHAWARDWINNAYEKGFVPDFLLDDYQQSITRGEFVKLAMGWLRCHLGKTDDQILAEKGLARLSFADTGDPVICAAAALGITSGVGGGSFGANDKFTREQAAAMVVSVLRITGFNTTNLQDAGFADLGAASDWARGTINIVGSSGIMAGVGESRFDPKATFSREQSIIVFGKIAQL